MSTRYRSAPLGGPARISARNHPTYEPLTNTLVCPLAEFASRESAYMHKDIDGSCTFGTTRVTEIEAHMVAAHVMGEAAAREWLTPRGFKDWQRKNTESSDGKKKHRG